MPIGAKASLPFARFLSADFSLTNFHILLGTILFWLGRWKIWKFVKLKSAERNLAKGRLALAQNRMVPSCGTRLTTILHAVDGKTVIWKINVAGLDFVKLKSAERNLAKGRLALAPMGIHCYQVSSLR
jgi:hypothetical protein